MRKSILFSLMAMIVLAMTACGGGDNANNSATTGGETGGETPAAGLTPQQQWDNLYKEGASWVYAMSGGTMWQKTEVKSVKDGVATLEQSTKMTKDGEFANPMPGESKRPAESTETPKADDKWKELGKGDETIKVGGTDVETSWVEGEYDGNKSKTWTSKKYGCIVKSEAGGAVSMELVELNAK